MRIDMKKKLILSMVAIIAIEFAAIVAFELRFDMLAAILFIAGFIPSAPFNEAFDAIQRARRIKMLK